MEFVDKISKVKLVLLDDVIDFYAEYMNEYDFRVESGGIIVGCLNPADRQVIITDITTPFPKDSRGRNYFRRSEYGHQQEMDRLWSESGRRKTYLGEWHTHNQPVPVSSFVDKRDWKRIGKMKKNYKQSFFIIVGLEKLKVWTISEGLIREMKEV